MKIVTTAQMRELERRAVAAGVSEDALMEAAGLAVAQRVSRLIDGIRGRRVVVLVGPGNNGGDGMVAARFLADWGGLVTLYMTSSRRREDKFEECRALRVRVVEADEDTEQWQLSSYVSLADVVIDAVLGIGNDRPLEGVIHGTLSSVNALKQSSPLVHYVAIDVPTGLHADTGACDDACFQAATTLALGAPKLGLYTFPGAVQAGDVETLDIGLPDGIDGDLSVELSGPEEVAGLLPERPMNSHKGTFGSILVVAGSRRFIGAPVLAAEAAYRSGAGLVTLAAPESAYRLAAPRLLEQVHLPQPETDDGYLAAGAATAVSEALAASDAAVIGPGLGNVDSVRRFLHALLLGDSEAGVPMVIDADALNGLAATYGWWEHLAPGAVLTPHPGEMSRLVDRPVQEVQEDRIEAAASAAARWGQVVVLKGAHTIVAAPDGRTTISPFANPGLATAGTGDVLSGIIGGLLGQGLPPYEAATAGVYVHAAAGQRVTDELGASGLLASELLPEVPKVMRVLRQLR
ncbi:MAG: NAD(P)H-hydrate dehydratase [Dehalococcoidia bacterium]